MTRKWFLVVPIDGTKPRVVSRPYGKAHDIVYQLNVDIPAGWQAVQDGLTIKLPEPTDANIEIEE